MSKVDLARWLLAGAGAAALSACVTLPPNHQRSPQDPWESWNRGVYRINNKLDRAVALPVTRAYVRHVPSPIRTGISNFFANVDTPVVMINDALQGKFKAAGNDLGRFLMNSVVGVGGLLDPASSAGLVRNYEDFGLTLGHWGAPPGPFLELPILGPSDLRDGPSKLVDTYFKPITYIPNDWVKYGLYLPYALDTRASLLPLQSTIDQAFDPYALIRDAFLSRRAYLVSDGKVQPDQGLVDPDADAADQSPAAAGSSIAAPATKPSPKPAQPAPAPTTPPPQ
ncbi:MAG TPA: VacJ family lipoprotein [Steroidobacteraceae bacterium]|nr:VacJ family lipoprotein [Steroidobacteraceae bacterium]